MTVVTISGKAGAGKDTLASIIGEQLSARGYTYHIAHFADLLKFIVKSWFHWDGKKDEKGRQMLQYIGTDVIRKQNPDYWVDFMADMLKFFNNKWDYVLIPDARFPNEIAKLKEQFCVVSLEVLRKSSSLLSGNLAGHISEHALDDFHFDCRVCNDSDIDDLRALSKTVTDFVIGRVEDEAGKC